MPVRMKGMSLRTNLVSVVLLGACGLKVGAKVIDRVPSSFYRIVAYLIVAGEDAIVSRQRLRALLWSEAGDAQASANLRQELRRIETLQRRNNFYFIGRNYSSVFIADSASVACDLRDVMEVLQTGASSHPLALVHAYKGELLADIGTSSPAFEEWLSETRERLNTEVADQLRSVLTSAHSVSPQNKSACARHLIKLDPCSEEAYMYLMREAAEQGNLSRVQSLFESCMRNLRNELGVPASDSLLNLHSELVRRD